MSLACGRFAVSPERCAANGFLRERADPGTWRAEPQRRIGALRRPRDVVASTSAFARAAARRSRVDTFAQAANHAVAFTCCHSASS